MNILRCFEVFLYDIFTKCIVNTGLSVVYYKQQCAVQTQTVLPLGKLSSIVHNGPYLAQNNTQWNKA